MLDDCKGLVPGVSTQGGLTPVVQDISINVKFSWGFLNLTACLIGETWVYRRTHFPIIKNYPPKPKPCQAIASDQIRLNTHTRQTAEGSNKEENTKLVWELFERVQRCASQSIYLIWRTFESQTALSASLNANRQTTCDRTPDIGNRRNRRRS